MTLKHENYPTDIRVLVKFESLAGMPASLVEKIVQNRKATDMIAEYGFWFTFPQNQMTSTGPPGFKAEKNSIVMRTGKFPVQHHAYEEPTIALRFTMTPEHVGGIPKEVGHRESKRLLFKEALVLKLYKELSAADGNEPLEDKEREYLMNLCLDSVFDGVASCGAIDPAFDTSKLSRDGPKRCDKIVSLAKKYGKLCWSYNRLNKEDASLATKEAFLVPKYKDRAKTLNDIAKVTEARATIAKQCAEILKEIDAALERKKKTQRALVGVWLAEEDENSDDDEA